MATLKELRDERIRKLNEIRAAGGDPYPANTRNPRTHQIAEIVDNFNKFEGKKVTLVGRIVGIRKFGKIAFIVIRDYTGEIQLFLNHSTISSGKGAGQGDGFGIEDLRLLDSGDFVDTTGEVIKTKTGEISIMVRKLHLISKSLRPMPTKQDGFTNKEERLRRRYVDMNVNLDVRERFVRRSKFWQATRDFLNQNGFIELNTPVLEHTAGGADANPFVTHMDSLDQDFYLRISQELPLKRLIGAGFERVFDIGPRFRNENYTDEHLPEHIAMEWYAAYWDWNDGMEFTENMVRYIADKTWGRHKFILADETTVDLGKDGEHYPRISFVEIIRDNYDIDVFDTTIEEVAKKLEENNLEVERTDSIARGLDKLWKKVRKTIPGPMFLVDIPVFLQPLAKKQAKDERLSEQFNLILGGTEACKAYSELNDPIDQLERFIEQQRLRNAGDKEAMMLDIDFVEMLEYGMPPTCGFGSTDRLFWLLEGVTAREGVPFPQLRREVDEVTKGIYGDVIKGLN